MRTCQYQLREPQTVELTIDARLSLANGRDICAWLRCVPVTWEAKELLMACVQAGQGTIDEAKLVSSVGLNDQSFYKALSELMSCGVVQVEQKRDSALGIRYKIRVWRSSPLDSKPAAASQASSKP